MSSGIIHVAVFDDYLKGATERITIKCSVDGVILVYPFEEQEHALNIIKWYGNLGMQVLTVPVDQNDFQNVLSHILEAIDDYCTDSQEIEFNVTCRNPILTIAACFAAMIIRAPIISLTEEEFSKVVKIQTADITLLTSQKRKILEQLSSQAGLVNQNDIARIIELSRSNVSRHIKSLAKAGYVECWREGRKKFVQITTLGTTLLRHKLLRKRKIWGTSKLQSTKVYCSVG
jgi:CRISPR locus-related DNA-binding protein